MVTNAQQSANCPFDASRDDRKTGHIAAEMAIADPRAQRVESFAMAREILRDGTMTQGGAGAELVDTFDSEKVPVFYLDGEAHKRKRAEIAKFFRPKTIATRYRAVMETATDALLAEFQAAGRGQLDKISFQLAVTVAADIVGLKNSNPAGMAARIRATMTSLGTRRQGGLAKIFAFLAQRYRALAFFYYDVLPAIKARRRQREDDVISHLIDKNYSEKAIMIECMTYAAAGMVTTREFIVVVAWHLFENKALWERFLAGDDEDQLAILQEILRLEPIAALLYRRGPETVDAAGGIAAARALTAIDLRAANTDEAITGPCPFALDPDRAERMQVNPSYLSFGDGSHRCPGWQVALDEARVFLDRLMRVPGIKLAQPPIIGWNAALASYELRDAIIACDRVSA